nr:reverse transcriptase domain-containing protein [Tanacetum cinerariifolium]
MLKYEVTYRLSTAYHPQTSGQVEVSNRGLKRILERTIGENRASWSDKLDDALWVFRTAYKTPIVCTPYKLVYGKACHLPIKLEHKAYWALKQANFDLIVAGDHRKVQLNELNELCDHAYENSLIYKEKTKRIHDSKIKNRFFNVGDRVLLFNLRLKIFLGKLKTRWSGPFTIAKVFPYGTIELSQANRPNFKVNGHLVKHYFGGDVPQLDCPDCKVLRALSFSFTTASHPQLHFGNPDCPNCKVSHALNFVLHSQELHILSFILGIQILLYGDGDLTTMKFIHAEVECSTSPIFTSSDIFPSGHIISPLKLISGVVAGTIWLLTSGRNLLKQCSYRISEEEPLSTYMR